MSNNQNLVESLDHLWKNFIHQYMQELEQFAKGHNLTMMQLEIIKWLYYEKKCDITQICNYLTISRSSTSQLIERMVQKGLVLRTDHETDRRFKQVQLSDIGRNIVEMWNENRRKINESLIADLSISEQNNVEKAIEALNQAIKSNS